MVPVHDRRQEIGIASGEPLYLAPQASNLLTKIRDDPLGVRLALWSGYFSGELTALLIGHGARDRSVGGNFTLAGDHRVVGVIGEHSPLSTRGSPGTIGVELFSQVIDVTLR